MKRTHLWRGAAVIIMGLFLLSGAACGKKGDPVPPEQPKGNAGSERPEKPAGPVPLR